MNDPKKRKLGLNSNVNSNLRNLRLQGIDNFIEYADRYVNIIQEKYLTHCYRDADVDFDLERKAFLRSAKMALSVCGQENDLALANLIMVSTINAMKSFVARVLSLETLKKSKDKGPYRKSKTELAHFTAHRAFKQLFYESFESIKNRRHTPNDM